MESSLRRTRSALSATTPLGALAEITTLHGPQVLRIEDHGPGTKLELRSLVFVATAQDATFAEDLREQERRRPIEPDEVDLAHRDPLERLSEQVFLEGRRRVEQRAYARAAVECVRAPARPRRLR
jgi:hypothetical protein